MPERGKKSPCPKDIYVELKQDEEGRHSNCSICLVREAAIDGVGSCKRKKEKKKRGFTKKRGKKSTSGKKKNFGVRPATSRERRETLHFGAKKKKMLVMSAFVKMSRTLHCGWGLG